MNKKSEEQNEVNKGFPMSTDEVRHPDPFTWEVAKNGTRFAIMIPCSDCGKPVQRVGWREGDDMSGEPKIVCVECFMKDDDGMPMMPPPPISSSATMSSDLAKINKYQQQRIAGQCAIGCYVPTIHCTEPATALFGIGSIIKVCDTHAKWNPENMLEGGKCPHCGKLADHDPSENKEDVELGDPN